MRNRLSSAVFVAGGMSLDIIVDLHAFPDARPGVVCARGSYPAVGGTSAGKEP